MLMDDVVVLVRVVIFLDGVGVVREVESHPHQNEQERAYQTCFGYVFPVHVASLQELCDDADNERNDKHDGYDCHV